MAKVTEKRESNKINLQLSVTGLDRFYYLLRVISEAGVVHSKDVATKLIPEARAKVGSWSKSSNDWHTSLSFEYMGLIKYLNDDEFAVSGRGQELLSAFDMQLVKNGTKLKPVLTDKLPVGQRCDLMYRVFQDTRIIQEKYGRDIHPYRMLFRFLSEGSLSHYITNREWVSFVESPDSLRDDQYPDYVARILALRSSKSRNNKGFKRLDRILTMLVDWGVLRRSGTGHDARFFFAKEYSKYVSFAGGATVSSFDEHDIEELFVTWLTKQPSNKGSDSITEEAARNYAAKLRLCVNKHPFVSLGCKNVYRVVDRDAFALLKEKIEAVEGFKEFDKAKANGNGYFSKALKYYDAFLVSHPELLIKKVTWLFLRDCSNSGLSYDPCLVKRFVAALLAKPFVILTGLSGSGKTKIAEAFVRWICGKDASQYKLVPVGADWTNSEKLLGYPNALKDTDYIMPDTGVLNLILEASKPENKNKPYFLILDEMNLSHVERYFADFLSTMEAVDGEIHLYDGDVDRYDGGGKNKDNPEKKVPRKVVFPKNLFVIGTMNVDETTYMFSPKVLDRAQVIEFCVNEKDMARYFAAEKKRLDFESSVDGNGIDYATTFLAKSKETRPFNSDAQAALTQMFPKLKKLGAEFGFRTAGEFSDFVSIYSSFSGESVDAAIDAAIVQKLLPKLHGSQGVFGEVIDELLMIARPPREDAEKLQHEADAENKKPTDLTGEQKYEYIYPLAAEKLERMQLRLRDNGFASFAEA